MEDLASDDQQLNRVKHYYYQQLQRKEEMILRLISRQKITLTDLRQQIEAVPSIVQTEFYVELSAKLKYLEKEHEALTQKYIHNHTFVTAVIDCVPDPCAAQSTAAPSSPLSPTSSSALRARIPSMVNRDSGTSSNIATAPALTNALLSCSAGSYDFQDDHSGDGRCPSSKFPRSLSMSAAAYNNKHNVKSPSHGPSSDPSGPSARVINRSSSNSGSGGRQTAGCKLIKTLPSPTNCSLKRSYSCSSESSPWDALQAPAPIVTTGTTSSHQYSSPQYAWSAGPSLEASAAKSLDETSSSADLPQDNNSDVLQSFHYSIVNQQVPRTLPPTPVWLTGSSPSTSDEVYTPAFEWNSERLPDFSVLG